MSDEQFPAEEMSVEDVPEKGDAEGFYDTPFSLNISFPEVVKIRMVDASALADYEVLLIVASLCSNAFFGFLVAYLTDAKKTVLVAANSGIFGVLTFGFFAWALAKRRLMTRRAKEFKVKGNVQEMKR